MPNPRRAAHSCMWFLCAGLGGCDARLDAAPWMGPAVDASVRTPTRAASVRSEGAASARPLDAGDETQDAGARASTSAPIGAMAEGGNSGLGTTARAGAGGAVDDGTEPSGPSQPEVDPGVPPEVAAHAADWPLPNFDYDNTRRSNTNLDSRNIARLQEAWRFTLPSSSTAFGYFSANPLILGEAVYLQDMQSNVYVLERRSGRQRWSRCFDEPTFGPNGVALGWGKLFATVGDSRIVALDLQGGQDLWELSPELGRSEGMDIQPVVYAKQLYAATVPVSTSRGVYEGGAHGLLLAVDTETGAQRWSFDTIDSEDAWGDPDANGGGGAWYPPLIDARSGITYWGTGNPVPWPGTVDQPNGASRPGPNLYTSSLVAVGSADGALRWYHQDQPHDIFDWDFQITPVLVRSPDSSGADLVIGAGKTGAVAALDAQTGQLVWRTKVGRHDNDELTEFPAQSLTIYPGVLGGVMSAMAYADGVLYVPSVDLGMSYDGSLLVPEIAGGSGVLSALDVRDGSVLWAAKTQGACYGAATLANDMVLTSDETGRVYAFARDSGDELWHYDAPGGINAPLVVAGDDLIVAVGMDMGLIIALSLRAPEPTTGTAGSAAPAEAGSGAAGSGAAPSFEPTWTSVYREVIERPGCNGGPTCHAGTLAGQLDMSTSAGAYAALVGVPGMGAGSGGNVGCASTGLLRVAPNDPDNSLLVQKLEQPTPVCGQRMPPSGMLSAERLQQLRMWITNGALED